MSATRNSSARLTDDIELVEANPWVPRLLGAIAVVLLGTGTWLCLKPHHRAMPRQAAATQPAEPAPEQAATRDYQLVGASWGMADTTAPPPPPREPTERERQEAEFMAKAREQWRGVEIFVRKQ
jgi:hypothetical protein